MPMQVFLEQIKFNHDPTSAATGAFNLRKNETEVVNVPEWRRGGSVRPADSEAAYAPERLNGRPTIRAKFSFSDVGTVNRVKIRALDGVLNPKRQKNSLAGLLLDLIKPLVSNELPSNILGAVAEREIDLTGGEEFELFFLEGARIRTPRVTVSDIVWRWQFRTDSIPWTDFETTTHRIYTVLARPKRPWKPDCTDPSNTQQPW